MPPNTGHEFRYGVERRDNVSRVANIRGVALPEGVLLTPDDVAPEARTLSQRSVQTIRGLSRWAAESRQGAESE
jgi:hypothetical protein